MKTSGSFLISTQKKDCGYLLEPPRRGGCNEYPQSMFLSRNKKINIYPCKPQFYCINVGFRGGGGGGGQNYLGVFSCCTNALIRIVNTDQTARMSRLIWIFVGHTCQKVRFLTLGLNCHLTCDDTFSVVGLLK